MHLFEATTLYLLVANTVAITVAAVGTVDFAVNIAHMKISDKSKLLN